MKNIVILGGGSGTFTLLSGLRKYPSKNTVVVSTADSGGSTGLLRKELGVMPPGDIRQCLIGLSYTTPTLGKLFNYRFDRGILQGHTVGNIIIAALEKVTGSAEEAISEASRFLNVRGEVLFASSGATTLSALYEDGKTKKGEHEIDEPKIHKSGRIKKLSLSKNTPNPKAIQAIKNADAIIFGPGDLYTSTLPNVLVSGISKAIGESKAKKILITNIMTKYGQTDNFKASDFLRVINEYLSEKNKKSKIDVVIVNSKKPDAQMIGLYKKENAKFVEADTNEIKSQGAEVVLANLISDIKYKKQASDKLKRSLIRHDSAQMTKVIWDILNK